MCISNRPSNWFDDYCNPLNSNGSTLYVLISAQDPYTKATLNFTGENILTEVLNERIFSAIESVNQKTIKLQTDVQTNKEGIKTNSEELSDLQPKVLENNRLIKEGINENTGISSTIESVKQTLTDKILKLEQSNITIHEKIKYINPCPETDSRYKKFGQTCYYFEVSKMNFANAKTSCKTKFGNSGGYLAEPLTASRAIELNKYANEHLRTGTYWIGYDNIGRGNKDFR